MTSSQEPQLTRREARERERVLHEQQTPSATPDAQTAAYPAPPAPVAPAYPVHQPAPPAPIAPAYPAHQPAPVAPVQPVAPTVAAIPGVAADGRRHPRVRGAWSRGRLWRAAFTIRRSRRDAAAAESVRSLARPADADACGGRTGPVPRTDPVPHGATEPPARGARAHIDST